MPRPGARLLLALAGVLLLAAPVAAAPLEILRADFSVHLDPRLQGLYAAVVLTLRNNGAAPLEVVELDFPPPLGPQAQVLAAWDRNGQLEWRSDPVEVGSPRELLVALRRPLRPGKKLVLGLRYELALADSPADTPAVITPRGARLATSGWYPEPARSSNPLPQKLRLVVRLPKAWRVHSPVAIKQRTTGTALSHYELEMTPVRADEELLRAEAPPATGSEEQ